MIRMLKLQALGMAIVTLSISNITEKDGLRWILTFVGWLLLAAFELLSMKLESQKAGKGEARR